MRIPEVREELLAIAHTIEIINKDSPLATKLRELEAALHRRPYVRRALRSAAHMDDDYRALIRSYAIEHPNIPYRNIGAHFGVDGGRVSEALAGFRD